MTAFPDFSLPYKEFIRFLNGGEYLDTFEMGSRTIDPMTWPTEPRKTNTCCKSQPSDDIVRQILERPWIDPLKFEAKKKDGSNKFQNRDAGKRSVAKTIPWQPTPADEAQAEIILKDMLDADLPLMLEDLDESCFITEKVTNETVKKSNKESKEDGIKLGNSKRKFGCVQHIEFGKPKPQPQAHSMNPPMLVKVAKTCYVPEKIANKAACTEKRMSGKVTDDNNEIKLDNSKIKLKQLYENIENEKKRRRIQVIEFIKPQTQAKKPPVKRQQIKKPKQLLLQMGIY